MHTTKRLYNLITEEAIFVLPPLLFFAGLMNYGWQRML